MKAVILAGGEGTRLRPITYKTPKPMVTVGGKPMLEWTIENLAEVGLKDIVIVVNYKKEVIKNYFKKGADWGVKISYVASGDYKGPAAVYVAKKFLKKGEAFLNLSADKVLKSRQIKKILNKYEETKADIVFGTGPLEQETIDHYGKNILRNVPKGITFKNFYSGNEVFSYGFFKYLDMFSKGDEAQNIKAIGKWREDGCKIAIAQMGKYVHVDSVRQLNYWRKEFEKKGEKIFR